MKKIILKHMAFKATCYLMLIAGLATITWSCNKHGQCNKPVKPQGTANTETQAPAVPAQQNAPLTMAVSVLEISTGEDGTTSVIFRELAQIFSVTDAAVITGLKNAYKDQATVKIVFDPWQELVTNVAPLSASELVSYGGREILRSPGSSRSVDLDRTNPDILNSPQALGVLNTTSGGLTNVIPDMATAQAMFNYIATQCCMLPGPYTIDYCIPFQYCRDGCYARAHKMCWILNKKYNYATHKIFSFAYPNSTYTLSVQAQKWRGCCVRWWYHVAPLVSIKTPSGVKAFVFDPAMFDQPVLLATWLHAQQNPACAGSKIPKVTSYNIQPTSSYSPADTSSFYTDPFYSSTNSTLTTYAPLQTCP